MYYICRFSDSWSLYDGKRNSSRPLTKEEVECLKSLFPGLAMETSKILTAIQVSSVKPAKLDQLINTDSLPSVKGK
jgi:hypothetical protein